MEDKNLYEKARARVTEIKEFYSHLISYIIVNAILIFINLMFSPGYLWFLWVTIGWGIGLVIHFVNVFGFGKEWEERKIQEFIEREKRKQQEK